MSKLGTFPMFYGLQWEIHVKSDTGLSWIAICRGKRQSKKFHKVPKPLDLGYCTLIFFIVLY